MKGIKQMNLACLILAAGKGERMRSETPKVMHPVAGLPMMTHVLKACEGLKADKIIVVIGPDQDQIARAAAPYPCAIQKERLGTGDAVRAARDMLAGFEGLVLVVFGDAPLLRPETLESLVQRQRESGAALVVGGFTPEDPASYGRLVVDEMGQLLAIVEAADAGEAQRAIGLCNGGGMLFEARHMWTLLDKVGNNNSKQEYYLTDCVKIANQEGLKVSVALLEAEDLEGANTRLQLAGLEQLMQKRLRARHMMAGVTMIDPESVTLAADTVLGYDVTIEPCVFFGTGVVVGDHVHIRAFSHLEQAVIEPRAVIGPFARIRPGSVIGTAARIGNFVEIKNSAIGAGAKVNHLSYIGDASVGMQSNIGAGTITCNYDGFNKMRTDIGAGTFVGSNSTLVAPLSLGDGVYIAAGSTITQDVPTDSLAVARERQTNNAGWAGRFRESQSKIKPVGRA